MDRTVDRPQVPIADSALATIGNTPLVRLAGLIPDNCADVLVKLEFFSPRGSYNGARHGLRAEGLPVPASSSHALPV